MCDRPPAGRSWSWDPTHNCTLELSVEHLKVAHIALDQRFLTSRSEVVPEGIWSGRSTIPEGVSIDAPCRVVPSDLVGDGVYDFEVVRKGAGSNLVVVGRVTPSTEPTRWGVVEDGCVGKVGTGVYKVKGINATGTGGIADE